MSKKIYSSPEITVTKIQLQSMIALSGVDEDGTSVGFGNRTGSLDGAASRRGGHSLWDDDE